MCCADVSYPATTDYYWGTIHKTMTDVNGVADNYEVTAGPFGFGQAISISSDKEQVNGSPNRIGGLKREKIWLKCCLLFYFRAICNVYYFRRFWK